MTSSQVYLQIQNNMKNQLNLADFNFFLSNFQQQDPLYGYFSAVAGQVRDSHKSQSQITSLISDVMNC